MFGRRRRRAEARAPSFNARGPWSHRRRFLPRRPPSSRRPLRALSAATPSPARALGRRHSRPPRSAATAAATAASPAPLLLRRLPGNAGSHGAHLPNRPGGKPLPARTGPPRLLCGQGQRRAAPLRVPGRAQRRTRGRVGWDLHGRAGPRFAAQASCARQGRSTVDRLSLALQR